ARASPAAACRIRRSTAWRATGPGVVPAVSGRVPGPRCVPLRRPAPAAPPHRRSVASPGTAPGSRRARGPPALDFGALLLAQADLLGRDFHQLVVVDEFQRLLERELHRRDQALVVVLAGGAEV